MGRSLFEIKFQKRDSVLGVLSEFRVVLGTPLLQKITWRLLENNLIIDTLKSALLDYLRNIRNTLIQQPWDRTVHCSTFTPNDINQKQNSNNHKLSKYHLILTILLQNLIFYIIYNIFYTRQLTYITVTGLFLYSLKTSKNLWFSDVFWGYRKRPVTWNGFRARLTCNLLRLLVERKSKKCSSTDIHKIICEPKEQNEYQ